ncbi:MAG: hypothetical protein JXR97_04345 [Planctomycetes bacterium]|nr:hypothetical protein [Planctomycetota bacterium]
MRFDRFMVTAGALIMSFALSGCGGSLFPDERKEARGNVKTYKEQLERNLKQRYNNTQEWAGKISRVELIMPRPPEESLNGEEVKVEFDQLVYDNYDNRVPELEKEYFIITFGSGQPRLVKTDPSLDVGLSNRGEYSESYPLRTGKVGGLSRTRPFVNEKNTGPFEELKAQPPVLRVPEMSAPVVPPAPEAIMPTQLTSSSPAEYSMPPVASQMVDKQEVKEAEGMVMVEEKTAPSLLNAMAAPEQIGTSRPRAEVHNLPDVMDEPELDPYLEPELDEADFR